MMRHVRIRRFGFQNLVHKRVNNNIMCCVEDVGFSMRVGLELNAATNTCQKTFIG
jgi:hypothetical protein